MKIVLVPKLTNPMTCRFFEPRYAFDLGVLTVDESIQVALKNNFGLQIENKELENRISQVTKEKSFYIPQLDLNASYNRKKDTADLVADSQDDQEYMAAIIQELPLGGKVSLAYSTGKTSIPSFERESTTIKGEETHFSSVGVSYTQPLLKNGLASPIFAEIKDANFDRDIQQIVLDDVQIQLVKRVRTGLYQLMRQQKAADINQKLLKISDDILNLIAKAFRPWKGPGAGGHAGPNRKKQEPTGVFTFPARYRACEKESSKSAWY